MLELDFDSASVSHKAGSEVEFEYSALDEDRDGVTVQVVRPPTHGSLYSTSAHGTTYVAGGANVTSDSFQLVAVDPHGAKSSVRTFTVILTSPS